MKVLEIENVTAGYNTEIDVLHDVSMYINENESVSLIGSNGAGKSTLLKVVSGLLHPKKGTIIYKGRKIDRMEPHEIVERGIIQITEEKCTFDSLTVEENLIIACQFKRSKEKKGENLAFAFETFPILKNRKDQLARTLSGGEQKMLAVARSIMQEPKILLLDDVSMGLAPKVVETLYSNLRGLKDLLKIPILLVEQNVEIALEFAERGYILAGGEIVFTGESDQLRESEEVKIYYLGA